MSRVIRIGVVLVILLSWSSISLTQNRRGPSTPEERATAVKAAKLLESNPFAKDAPRMRQWFTQWLIEVPDITVQACTKYFGSAGEKKYRYSSELLTQSMFSSAAFIIEHPDAARDRLSVNVAGVEGALRMYGAMVRTDPKAQHEFLDQLSAKLEKGELRGYVEQIGRTDCRGRN